jgi:rod shape determining protein RodA
VLLAVVMVPGVGVVVNGARSWIDLPGGIRLQPSELAKITTIIALARFLAPEGRARSMDNVLSALGIAALPAAMIAVHPDLGSALMFVPVALAIIFVAGARLKHLAILALIVAVLLPVAWFQISPTQRTRITTWLGQGRQLTQAERVGQYHHLIQSKVAVGSGGWTGKGLGHGTQNKLNYLGFRNTDFIFAVICEEAGFFGANVILLLYLLLVGSGLTVAQRCREPAGRLMVVGVIALFATQGVVNIAMTIGLLPIVGITLPFVSYGGSSTLASFLGVALVLNVALRRPSVTFSRQELSEVTDQYR